MRIRRAISTSGDSDAVRGLSIRDYFRNHSGAGEVLRYSPYCLMGVALRGGKIAKDCTLSIAKHTKNIALDINGTNVFSKYQCASAKVEPHTLLAGKGYKDFKTLSLWCLLICPGLIFVFPQLYMFYVAQYAFDVVRCTPQGKLKEKYPESHRQKRMKKVVAERNARRRERRLRAESTRSSASGRGSASVAGSSRGVALDPITFEGSLC